MSNEDLLARVGHTTEETEFYTPMPPGYRKGHHKYVIVVGTVMSGLGKGIFSSSLAKLLQDKGMRVAPIKMEGYLNIDSGTLNPYRHGEVFVLDDGMETDMDLGTYERMLNQDLSRLNFTTSGQVFSRVLEKERRGSYLGRDVQMIPQKRHCAAYAADRADGRHAGADALPVPPRCHGGRPSSACRAAYSRAARASRGSRACRTDSDCTSRAPLPAARADHRGRR